MITDREASVLAHTSDTGRYVTDEGSVIDLAGRGLLFDYGPQRLADGMHYFVMTSAGRQALREWREAQPKPKVQRRRRSRAFEDWKNYSEAFGEITFKEFLCHRKAGAF